MTQPVDVDLNLGGDYTQGVAQATQATEGLAVALNTLQAPSRSVQSALNAATPTKVHLAAWGGFTAAAAYWQQQTSGIRATASAAGQSMRVLGDDVNRLARTFPIGTQGAVALVQAVQGLGAQQQRVLPLAQNFERLAKATNSFGPEIAEGFGQLNRSMASLDPARVARFGDVLTTVSARSGASAMGMISFSRAIAPVAQQAGIGMSAVLGISSAFVKLGDDGGAAATAVNKILGDLNRSVREGSNDMAAYAQITGMTVDKFRQLYQANPAQALASVTTAIGRAGPRGQMELENLGLEGVRTQRALLQLSQSGGLQSAVNQAVGAYGNGSTQRAAAAAMGGLNDSLTELRSTAGQTADTLGGPFLKILTRLTDVAKVGLAPVNAVLGSGVGQAGILGLGALAVTGRMAAFGARRLGPLAIGAQAVTSGPVRGLAGGYALGRTENDLAMAERMRLGRFGMAPATAYAQGDPYGRGFMQPLNRGFTQAGYILGQFRSDLAGQPLVPGGAPMGPSAGGVLRRGARIGVGVSSMAYEGWMRAFADPLHQAVTPAGERTSLLTPGQGGLFSQAAMVRQQAGMRAALGFLEREGTGSAKALARFSSATLGATRSLTTFAARGVEAGAMAGASALRGVLGSTLGLVGGVGGAALLGGGLAYSAYRSSQQSNAAEKDRIQNLDMYSVLNGYRDAMGQAGEAAVSLADQMQQARLTIGNSVNTMPRALSVSAQDVAAAGPPDRSKAQHIYRGSAAAIAGQIGALNLQGLSPQDVQGVKMDLLKQGIRPDEADRILGMVGRNNAQGGVASASTVSGLVGGVAASARTYSPSIWEALKRHPTGALGGGMSDWQLIGSGAAGSKPLVGAEGTKTLDLMQNAIMQQYADLSGHFSQAYAVQRTVRTANSALRDALNSGDPDTVAAVAQRLGVSLTGNKNFHVSAAAVQAAGGDITQLVGNNKVYGRSLADWRRQGVTTTGAGAAANRINTGDYAAVQSAGASMFLPYFANQRPGGTTGRAYDAISAFEAQPANARLQTAAVQQFVGAAQAAGNSLAAIAMNANRAIGTTSGATQALMQGAYGESEFQLQRRLIGANRGTTLAQQSQFYGQVATSPAEGPDAQKNIADARQHLLDLQNQEVSFYQQRVMAQYQYQIQVGRSQQDFQRQTARSEQDYLIGRQRAWRDFSIQQRRQAQDAAAQMYNPYERIQVQPSVDAFNLVGNRQEQIAAMRNQLADIRTLKRLGLSQDAVDQLQLYDPNKAQQVAMLVSDVQSSRSLVGTMNRQATAMRSLSGQLVSQSPEYRRQRQDFQRSLRDQQADFERQQSRARQDYSIAMTRMAQDLHTQDLEITNNMTQLTADMNKILHGQAVDLSHQVTSSLKDTLSSVRHFAPLIHAGLAGAAGGGATGGSGPTGDVGSVNLTGSQRGGGAGNAPVSTGGRFDVLPSGKRIPLAGGGGNLYVAPGTATVAGVRKSTSSADPNRANADERPSDAFMRAHPANPAYNKSIAKAMMPSWATGAKWAAWESLWDQESGWNQYEDNPQSSAYGIPQILGGGNYSKYFYRFKDWRTNPASQIAAGIAYIKDSYHGDPREAMRHENKMGWYGSGSIFTGPHVVGLGERGPEAAIPLNAQGIQFMVTALRQYAGSAREIVTGGLAHATHVTYTNDSYTYDNGTHFHGDVHVQADSPEAIGRAVTARQKRANLTQPRSVRWQRTTS